MPHRKPDLVALLALVVIVGLACNFPGLAAPAIAPSLPPPPIAAPSAAATGEPPSLPPPTQSPTPTATPPPPIVSYTPIFEPAACQFYVPEGYVPQCGYLVVPEYRHQPNSPSIRLHVAIFKSTSSNPAPDPVIHLGGGPGSPTLGWASYLFSVGLDGFLAQRDYILFDQRGTQYSVPRLNCPERDDLTATLLSTNPDVQTASALELDAYARCRDRLMTEGVNLAAYNSAASAADVNDLRIALGYGQVNLYGVSYGTRLALTVMRDYPQGIRSVILDSPYPPQVNLYTSLARNAERAFDMLFDGCAADLTCNAAYPDLKNVFYRLVARLEATPLPVVAYDRTRGANVNVIVDGDVLIDVVFDGLYRADTIPTMPALIYETDAGNTTRLSRRLGLSFDRDHSAGMTNSVQCNEELSFTTYDDVLAESAGVQPQLRDHYNQSLQVYFKVCEMWGAGRAEAIENEAVSSDIPTLLLTGEYDPITPPEWAYQTAEMLPNSFVFEFPGWGHWIMRSGWCGLQIGLAFVDNPTTLPDSSCIAGLGSPDFVHY